MDWNQNRISFDKLFHMSHLRALSRRGVALGLAAVMWVGMIPTSLAAGTGLWPIQATTYADGSGEAPTITIETNGVIDESNKLTGFVEVAIRVKPGQLHLDGAGNIVAGTDDPYDHSEIQPFGTLAVALEYSDKLTPWGWEKVDGNWDKLDAALPGNEATAVDTSNTVGKGFSASGMVEIDPLHKSTRIAQAAVSGKDGGGGYLYLMADGFTAKEFNGEDTVLAVVRFKYELSAITNENPWSTMFSKGLKNPNVTNWIDPSKDECLVKLVDAALLDEPADPTAPNDIMVDYEVVYNSGKSAARPQGNGFYYSADTDDGLEAYDPSKADSDPAFVSTTSNLMGVALVDTTIGSTPSTTTVVPGKVNYTLVNRLSYNFDSGDSAVVVYHDWDGREIGIQVLSPGDAREEVNEYVEKHFIYPDLQYSAHKGDADARDYSDSLLREDTYRGKYPYNGPAPIPDVASKTYAADLATYQASIDSWVVDDGEDYPLTNKLDYVFFKRYTQMTETTVDPDGVPGNGDETVSPARTLVDPDGVPGNGDEYYHTDSYDAKLLGNLTVNDVEEPELLDLPYIYGWAVVADIDHIDEVWTTLGAGEHTPYIGMDTGAGNVAVDTTIDTSYTGMGKCLQFADFSDLERGEVLHVQAVYEPGPELLYNGFYTLTSQPEYERYGDASTSLGGVYAISFSYDRVNTTGAGVSRMRDPSVRVDYTPDVGGVAQKPFSVGIDVENTDFIPITFTPSSALMSMEYSLRDKQLYDDGRFSYPVMVEYNYYTGAERASHGNLNNVMQNFNYAEHPYSKHLGSMGFVAEATFNQIEKLCREAAKTGSLVDIQAYINIATINDLNWKSNLDGAEYRDRDITMVIRKLVDAYQIANGADLDWHQIQYHLITSTYSGGVVSGGLTNVRGVVYPTPDTLAYHWCRIDDCSGGAEPIGDLSKLLESALKVHGTPANPNALNLLNDTFYLRQGITAKEFDPSSNLQAFKDAIVKVVDDLRTGTSENDIKAMSWEQVQYLLDKGGSSIPAQATAEAEDYWWKNNGRKTISTWQELLEIQYHIDHDNYFAGDAAAAGWRSGYTDPTVALTGRVREKDSGGNWLTSFTTKDVALRKNDGGDNFETLADFDNALKTAITALTTAPAYAGGSFDGISLLEIQHALLGKGYRSESDLTADTDKGDIKYWWITGAPGVTDLRSLVQLVEQVLDGAPDDLLENVTVSLVSGAPYWLRGGKAGSNFADDDALHTALKTAVDTWRKTDSNNSASAPWPEADGSNWNDTDTRKVWSQLQHLLLGESYEDNPDPGPTYQYWWYGNGHKPIGSFAELIEAAWNTWGNESGDGTPPSGTSDPNAMDALKETEENKKFINGVKKTEENFRLDDLDFRKDVNGTPFDSVGEFTRELKKTIINLVKRDSSLEYIKGQDWIVIQHMLLGNTYRPATNAFGTGLRDDKEIDYWWEDGGSKSSGPSVNYDEADAFIAQYVSIASTAWDTKGDNLEVSDVSISIPADVVTKLNLQDGSGNVLTETQIVEHIVDAVNEYCMEVWGNGGTSSWQKYEDYPNLKLDWKSFQYWILHKDETNINDKEKALKDKTYEEISVAPYNIPWTPVQNVPAVIDYTWGDTKVAEYVGIASTAWDTKGDNLEVSDVSISIPADAVAKLNLQDGSGSVLTEEQIIGHIVDAVNEYCMEAWGNGGTSDWQGYEDYPNLKLDWKSFQYWILHKDEANISDKEKALKDKTYEEISGAPYNITWTPVQDVPTVIDYTWGDTKVAEYVGTASTAWDTKGDNLEISDVSTSIPADVVTKLNLQDGSGNVLTETQIVEHIVNAVNEYCMEVWGNGGTSSWQKYEDYPNLKLDWKSFQYWILHKDETNINDKEKALKDKTFEEISGAPYNIAWTPDQTETAAVSNAVRRAPLNLTAAAPETATETSRDGMTKTTTTTEQVYNKATGSYDTVTTVTAVTRAQTEGATVVTTTVTKTTVSVDPATGEVTVHTTSDTSTTVEAAKPAQKPEEEKTSSTYENDPDTTVITPETPKEPATPTDPETPEEPATPADPEIPTEPKDPEDKEDDKPSTYQIDKDTTLLTPESGGEGIESSAGGSAEGSADPGGTASYLTLALTDEPEETGQMTASVTRFEAGMMRVAQLLSTPAAIPQRVSTDSLAETVPKLMDLREPLLPQAVTAAEGERGRLLTRWRASGRDGPLALLLRPPAAIWTSYCNTNTFTTGRTLL